MQKERQHNKCLESKLHWNSRAYFLLLLRVENRNENAKETLIRFYSSKDQRLKWQRKDPISMRGCSSEFMKKDAIFIPQQCSQPEKPGIRELSVDEIG